MLLAKHENLKEKAQLHRSNITVLLAEYATQASPRTRTR
jgi:hypothetical protein